MLPIGPYPHPANPISHLAWASASRPRSSPLRAASASAALRRAASSALDERASPAARSSSRAFSAAAAASSWPEGTGLWCFPDLSHLMHQGDMAAPLVCTCSEAHNRRQEWRTCALYTLLHSSDACTCLYVVIQEMRGRTPPIRRSHMLRLLWDESAQRHLRPANVRGGPAAARRRRAAPRARRRSRAPGAPGAPPGSPQAGPWVHSRPYPNLPWRTSL